MNIDKHKEIWGRINVYYWSNISYFYLVVLASWIWIPYNQAFHIYKQNISSAQILFVYKYLLVLIVLKKIDSDLNSFNKKMLDWFRYPLVTPFITCSSLDLLLLLIITNAISNNIIDLSGLSPKLSDFLFHLIKTNIKYYF